MNSSASETESPLAQAFNDALKTADAEGLLFASTDLPVAAILEAYRRGVFPWPVKEGLIGWFCPDPRHVLRPSALRINRSLRKALKQRAHWSIRCDTAFDTVVAHCATAERPEQVGTWITPQVKHSYHQLHRLGFAHSVEVWSEDRLVGGLYGVALGHIFFGESMFHFEDYASKAALVGLSQLLEAQGYACIDCQVHTPHTEAMGASPMSRTHFLRALETWCAPSKLPGRWSEQVEVSAATLVA